MPMKVESMPEQALRSTTMQRAPWARQCSAQALTWGLVRKLPFPLQRIQEKSSNLAQSISLSGVTCVRAGFFLWQLKVALNCFWSTLESA